MKPSELNENTIIKMSRQCGRTNLHLAIAMEILRQQILGIDEDIEDNISIRMTEIKVGGNDR